jgi:hypothetical protein
VLLVGASGHVARKHVHTTCDSKCRCYVDGRAQHTRRILVQLRKHVENLVSSSLHACRNTTCTEPGIEACITCACTNFGPQNTGRKSDVCARSNWGVSIWVPMSVNNAPWFVVRNSVFAPPVELHGHRGSVWRVIKCLPLLPDFMGRVYIDSEEIIYRYFQIEISSNCTMKY